MGKRRLWEKWNAFFMILGEKIKCVEVLFDEFFYTLLLLCFLDILWPLEYEKIGPLFPSVCMSVACFVRQIISETTDC